MAPQGQNTTQYLVETDKQSFRDTQLYPYGISGRSLHVTVCGQSKIMFTRMELWLLITPTRILHEPWIATIDPT